MAVLVKVTPGVPLIDHYLVTAIEIIIPATVRQAVRKDPAAVIKKDELVAGHTIIGFYVREVIVFRIVITGRPPCGLQADIDVEMNLGTGSLSECRSNNQGAE
jgi:hypothetical protein